jgi:MFS family permease
MTAAQTMQESHAQAPAAWTPRALFTLVCLGVTAGTQMSDMGVQALSLSAIQRSFDVSDAMLGALQGMAGVLVGSAVAIPLARFADRFSRKLVLLCLIMASTTMMVLSALAPNFPLFFLGRSAASITEFAMVPLVYSMIPDLAPDRHRVAANLGFAALMAVGASGGFYFGGVLIQAADAGVPLAIEPWRKAFLLLSLAGVPLLLLGLLTLDPPRHIAAGPAAAAAAVSSLRQFLRQRWQSVALFVGVAGCLAVGVQALNQLITLALERRFDANLDTLGRAMGQIVLATTVGCLPVAMLLDRWLGRRWGRAARPFIMGAGAALAIPCIAVLAVASGLDQALWAVGLFLFVTCTANALVPTMLQDLAPPELRARSFAIWSFVVSVFIATGPLIAGALSESVLQRQLLQAIAWTSVPALVLSAVCAVRYFSMQRTARPA